MNSENRSRTVKDQNYWSILTAALELDFSRGHLRWTVSDLARKSKVSRSLIYYYFGRSKEGILLSAVSVIGEELFGLSSDRLRLWQEGRHHDSVEETKRWFQNHPQVLALYFAHRFRPTHVGEAIRALEAKFDTKLKKFNQSKAAILGQAFSF